MIPPLSLFALGAAVAQEPRALSLEDALRMAQDTSESIAVAEADVQGAEGDVWAARSGWLPTIAAQGTYTRTFATEFSQIFADAGGGGSFGPFGRENAYRFEFTGQQLIYGGGATWARTRIASLSRESAEISLDAERASAALDAAQAYYDAALADEVLTIARESLAQAEKTYEEVRLGFEVGRNAEFDVLRAQVEVENQRVAVIRQERLRETAHLRLAQVLDLPPGEPVQLTTPLDAEGDVVGAAARSAGMSGGEEAPRAAVRQLENVEAIRERSLSIQRAELLPTLSLSASMGWTHYPDTVLPKSDPDLFYENASASVVLSVPIFAGGRVHGALMSARADVASARANRDLVEEVADLESRDARTNLKLAEAQWEATSGTVAQARRAYEIAEVRYQEGLSTQTELADSRLLLRQAEVNRAQAARDLQVARIRVALLPALPVGGASAASAPSTGAASGASASF